MTCRKMDTLKGGLMCKREKPRKNVSVSGNCKRCNATLSVLATSPGTCGSQKFGLKKVRRVEAKND